MSYRDPVTGLPFPSAPSYPSRRLWIAPLVFLPCLVLAVGVALWAHNSMVGQLVSVNAAWAQVESNLQRRADLIPRLVETVRRGMRHESEVLETVVRERQRPMQKLEAAIDDLSQAQLAHRASVASLAGSVPSQAEDFAALARRSADITRGVRSVMAIAESYPVLRSSDQLLELQAQLEGTENRINAARMAFNDAVAGYNAALVQLPTSLVANAKGLEPKAFFKASEDAHVATALGL